MKIDIEIYKARFTTAGKTTEDILSEYDDSIGPEPTAEEIEMWRKTLNAIDGAEVFVTDSFYSSLEDRFTIISWPDSSENEMVKFIYAAEQDPMFGTYQNEKEQFIKDWEAGNYESTGSLSVSASDIKIIEKMKRSNDWRLP